MKTLAIIMLAAVVSACGGGDCTGTPIVAIGTDFSAPGACVTRIDAAAGDVDKVAAAVDAARAAAGMPRAYIVATGTGAEAALNFMGSRPGYVDIASLWLPTYDAATSTLDGLRGSLVSVYLNAGDDSSACAAAAARILAGHTFASCTQWLGLTSFTPAQWADAVRQLNL